ncbi:hypothetical protein [Aliiruegeria sabulilitoris]|uniref:hypothetical protein n=1 Tax=Aliiruegeria sabulilitoris TaxID=1510458 RepID=UPI0012E3A185|nr:hypothetical protein [Aliiruegeria sabulilitoris]NDR57057.1 hypothetical protein [Pseudoruegeria sp. M32A2M]
MKTIVAVAALMLASSVSVGADPAKGQKKGWEDGAPKGLTVSAANGRTDNGKGNDDLITSVSTGGSGGEDKLTENKN